MIEPLNDLNTFWWCKSIYPTSISKREGWRLTHPPWGRATQAQTVYCSSLELGKKNSCYRPTAYQATFTRVEFCALVNSQNYSNLSVINAKINAWE